MSITPPQSSLGTAEGRKKRVLLAYPRFNKSHLLNYEFMMRFYPGKRGVMPPTGLLVIAALFDQAGWEVRLTDENVEPVKDQDLDWADVIGVSGMHQQRAGMLELIDAGNRRG